MFIARRGCLILERIFRALVIVLVSRAAQAACAQAWQLPVFVRAHGRGIESRRRAGVFHAFYFGDAIFGRDPRRCRAGVTGRVIPRLDRFHRRIIDHLSPVTLKSNAKPSPAGGNAADRFFKARAFPCAD